MVNDSNRDDPSFDIGFQGLASLGAPGIGPVDIGSVPNTFGSMPGNTPTTMGLTQAAIQGLGASPDVQISGLGGVPRPGVSDRKPMAQGMSFQDFLQNQFQEPKDFVKFGTGILSLIPNPVQPLAQIISKGLTLSDISDAVQGKGTGIMQTVADTMSNFDLGAITKKLADIATQNEPSQ